VVGHPVAVVEVDTLASEAPVPGAIAPAAARASAFVVVGHHSEVEVATSLDS